MTGTTARVTTNGQVSLPAAMRKRWGARRVLVLDKGDYAIVRPLPDDIPSALMGSLPPRSPLSAEEMRAQERALEADRE